MHNKPKILVVGSLVLDLTTRTEKFPGSGETVLGKDFHTASGGKGANQAVQAARLGADVTMVGKVGNDDFGNKLISSCKSMGIHTKYITVDCSTSSAVGNVILEISENKATKNRIIVVPGANMTITPENVAFLKDDICHYDMVVLQQEIPTEINEIVAKYAYDEGIPVMLNPAPSSPLTSDFLSRLSYISPNEHEVYDLTGIKIHKDGKSADKGDLKSAANVLLKQGVKTVIITLGNAGAVVATNNEFIYQPCIDVVKVLDPTAAGDSFIGAFVTGISIGLDLHQALNFANYTATLTVSRIGAQPSLPYLNEVISLMEKEKYLNTDTSCLKILKKSEG